MDTTTIEHPTPTEPRELAPSGAYDLVRTVTEADTTFKALFATAAAAHGGNGWDIPRADRDRLSEDHRRACVRLTTGAKSLAIKGTPRVSQEMARVEDGPSGPVITCTGACGETKPVNKFPTLKGGGNRGSECRACGNARRDAAKASAN